MPSAIEYRFLGVLASSLVTILTELPPTVKTKEHTCTGFQRLKLLLFSYLTFKAYRRLYVPPGLTPKIIHGDHLVFTCSGWILEQTADFSLYNINRLDFVTEMESVHCACAICTESLYNTETFLLRSVHYRCTLSGQQEKRCISTVC